MLNSVIHASNANAQLLEKMVSDIDDKLICEQPANLPNHPLWQLGHLAYVRAYITKMGPNPFVYPEAWMPLFAKGSTPSNDKSIYPTKSMVHATFNNAHKAAIETVKSLTPEQLDSPHSIDNFKESYPKLGDLLVLMLVGHDGMHLGQISDWRRAMNLPRVM